MEREYGRKTKGSALGAIKWKQTSCWGRNSDPQLCLEVKMAAENLLNAVLLVRKPSILLLTALSERI